MNVKQIQIRFKIQQSIKIQIRFEIKYITTVSITMKQLRVQIHCLSKWSEIQ